MGLEKKILSNLIYAFSAQIISLLLSLLMSIVVPKFLGITDYAYWQLFVFYSNYVNIAQFGIVDGIYLKLGGENYDKLDYAKLGSQFRIYCIFQIIVACLISVCAYLVVGMTAKLFVFVCVAIYMVVYNLSRYLGFIFQTVNNTKWFSISSMIDRITILVLGAIAVASKSFYWRLFVCIYLLGISVSLIYTVFKGRKIVFRRNHESFNNSIVEIKVNIKIGLNLMVSNLASMLILGCGRQFVESHWGLEMFGKVSFALSMTNFFLLFINQVSLVMFPALRKIDLATGKEIFIKLSSGFSLLSPIVYVIYIPASIILAKWLPQYEISLQYLMLFMPICVFDGKMQMIYTTYLKVLRKERLLLYINVFSMALSFVFCCISTFVFYNLNVLLVTLVLTIMIRSLIANRLVTKQLGMKNLVDLYDIVFAIGFIITNCVLSSNGAFIVMLIAFVLYIILKRKTLINMLFGIK